MPHDEKAMVLTLGKDGRFRLVDHSGSREDAHTMLRAAWEALDDYHAPNRGGSPELACIATDPPEADRTSYADRIPDFVKRGKFRHRKDVPCTNALCSAYQSPDHFEAWDEPPPAPAAPPPAAPIAHASGLKLRHRADVECDNPECYPALAPEHFEEDVPSATVGAGAIDPNKTSTKTSAEIESPVEPL